MSCNKVLGPRGEVIVVYGTGVRYGSPRGCWPTE